MHPDNIEYYYTFSNQLSNLSWLSKVGNSPVPVWKTKQHQDKFFITPNIRVLSRMAKFASFAYPNPHTADTNGQILPADDKTWKIATTILKKSDNPYRVLEREGLVLIDSYAKTPWLIYNNDNAPWHAENSINVFTRRYLGYHSGQDREFMVRAHINLVSVIKYLLNI